MSIESSYGRGQTHSPYECTKIGPSEEELRFKDGDRRQAGGEIRKSVFSTITSCFSGCMSCCGENSEAEFAEEVEPSFVVLAARSWWNPKPFGEEINQDGTWVKGGAFISAGLSACNTVAKIFFTAISFIPGSSSEFVKDNIIDIDERSNEGLVQDFEAKQILPALFAALAVTVNPYAKMGPRVSRTDCIAYKVFQEAVDCAKAGMIDEYEGTRFSDDSGVKEFLLRNIVSRFLFLTSTVLYVAEKIVHLAIGVILTACAAVTLFRHQRLNTQAREYLGALDVVDRVCDGLRATLYPWQNLDGVDLSDYRDPLP